ncbi:MAG: transporter [Gammaproteobacteria bacterium]
MQRPSLALLGHCTVALACAPAISQASHTAATSLGTSSGGAINTESAVPLQQGSWAIGYRYERQVSDRLTDDQLLAIKEADLDADVHSVDAVISNTLIAAYGLTPDLTIGLALPYIERQDVRAPEFNGTEVELLRDGDSKGLGDVKVYGLWRFYQDAATTRSVALIVGAGIPTGKDDEKTREGERFEAEFQPGSGSWDPFAGVAYTQGFGRLGFDASLGYTLVNEGAQNTDLGDYLSYNASVAWALKPDASVRWNLVLELNGLHRDKQQSAGETNSNSGGDWLNLAPGITVAGQHWGAYANLGFPLVNEPNGDQDKQDYRFLIGVRYLR